MTATSLSAKAGTVRGERVLLGAAALGELEGELPALLDPAGHLVALAIQRGLLPADGLQLGGGEAVTLRSSSRRAAGP
jgi:hypothetical protein